MPDYKTPGVYVEEISSLPASVASVETAIPAFIGYTETGATTVQKIGSMLEYENAFGGASPETFTWDVAAGTVVAPSVKFRMYYAMQMYFANGGGPCYVVSVGGYGTTNAPRKKDFGLDTGTPAFDPWALLEKEDEPTLIVVPDDFGSTIYNEIMGVKAIPHCDKMGDRFALLDVEADQVSAFRSDSNIGIGNHLRNAAAYTPALIASISIAVDKSASQVTYDVIGPTTTTPTTKTLADLETANNALYHEALAKFQGSPLKMGPSAALAGIYASNDAARGVWSAPANISVRLVSGLSHVFSPSQLDGLNIDASGKSINPIRFFTGRGNLVYGARTLAGNDNEWRFINVRRFFLNAEESIRKAVDPFVFETNDANTWARVKGMIENYLDGLWRQGALQGASPKDAYFVNVGLGQTMTAQDVLEGKMIVQIGMAAVRPAEFIILNFTHKLPS